MKKTLYILICFISISSLATLGISFYIVTYFLGKRINDISWHQKINSYKEDLMKNYAGQPVSIITEDNINLAGLLFIRPQAQRTLLVCHGWLMNKERLRVLVQLFDKDNILLFDFRAHGESQGDYTSIGFHEKKDVIAAYKFIQQHPQIQHLPIFGLGISMGAASLLSAAAEGIPFTGLIIDSVFGRLDQVMADAFARKTGFPVFPFLPICQSLYEYLAKSKMEDVNTFVWANTISSIPIFMIHSKQDKLAKYTIAQELYESIKVKIKKLWSVDDAEHATIYKHHAQEYAQQVNAFFNMVDHCNSTSPSILPIT